MQTPSENTTAGTGGTAAPASNRKVTLVRDDGYQYPELWLEIYIEGVEFEQHAFADMFSRAKCKKATSPEGAAIVVFTGGVDVDPALYGCTENIHPQVDTPDPAREKRDMEVYKTCLDNGIPMFGVCRGAQFLHVMNGGKLYQHVTNHTGAHDMWDIKSRRTFKVSSVHHQMVVKNNDMTILGDCSKPSEKWLNATEKDLRHGMDVEAFYYRDTDCFGVQGHPEYKGYPEFAAWCIERMIEFFVTSEDTELRGRYRRLKESVIDARNMKLAEQKKELN